MVASEVASLWEPFIKLYIYVTLHFYKTVRLRYAACVQLHGNGCTVELWRCNKFILTGTVWWWQRVWVYGWQRVWLYMMTKGVGICDDKGCGYMWWQRVWWCMMTKGVVIYDDKGCGHMWWQRVWWYMMTKGVVICDDKGCGYMLMAKGIVICDDKGVVNSLPSKCARS